MDFASREDHSQVVAAFREWGRIRHRRSDTLLVDAMIAATAKVRGLTVATRNVADFRALGVEVFDPVAGTAVPERP